MEWGYRGAVNRLFVCIPKADQTDSPATGLGSGRACTAGGRNRGSKRVPGDEIHAVANGVMQSRGKPRPSDGSTRPVAALIPRDPNGYQRETACRLVPRSNGTVYRGTLLYSRARGPEGPGPMSPAMLPATLEADSFTASRARCA